MTIREMYKEMEADLDAVLGRLMKEALVARLVKKYESDTNFELLSQSLKDKNYEEAFRAVHTLKGVALNLGFDKLAASSSKMTEELRAKKYDNLDKLFNQVKTDNEQVLKLISQLD